MRRALGMLVLSFGIVGISPHADARGGGGGFGVGFSGGFRGLAGQPPAFRPFTGFHRQFAAHRAFSLCIASAPSLSAGGEASGKFPYGLAGGHGGSATMAAGRIYRLRSRLNPRSSSFRPPAKDQESRNPRRTIHMRAATQFRTGITVMFIREPAEGRSDTESFSGGLSRPLCPACLACPWVRPERSSPCCR
jgi:hypothetical protein